MDIQIKAKECLAVNKRKYEVLCTENCTDFSIGDTLNGKTIVSIEDVDEETSIKSYGVLEPNCQLIWKLNSNKLLSSNYECIFKNTYEKVMGDEQCEKLDEETLKNYDENKGTNIFNIRYSKTTNQPNETNENNTYNEIQVIRADNKTLGVLSLIFLVIFFILSNRRLRRKLFS